MIKRIIVAQVETAIRARLEGEGAGSDWWHIDRVRNTALALAREEGADPFITELAALVHDIADPRFHGGDETLGPAAARALLTLCGTSAEVIDHVADIVATITFKGAGVATPMQTVEGRCAQDADRLDALGAIGIARCFAFGAHAGRPLYVPGEAPQLHQTTEAYRRGRSSSLLHFHEKLYLLPERMNTATARRLAGERVAVMRAFEAQFLAEWAGAR